MNDVGFAMAVVSFLVILSTTALVLVVIRAVFSINKRVSLQEQSLAQQMLTNILIEELIAAQNMEKGKNEDIV